MSPDVLAVAVPGRTEKVCEDSALAHVEGDAVVVADGLGSTGHGARAARLATRLVLDELRPMALADAAPAALAERLRGRHSEAVGGDRKVATTCLFLLRGSARVYLGRVGDGLAIVALRTGQVQVFGAERDGFTNETASLPRDLPEVRAWPADEVEAALLATDGVADDLRPGSEAALLHGFAELLRQSGPVEARERIQHWLTHWSTPNSHDDRALALYLRPSEIP